MPAPNAVAVVRRFTETTGAGTYRASVHVPHNAILKSVRVYNRVAWTAASSAALTAGSTVDGTDVLTSQNLKSGVEVIAAADADLDVLQPTPSVGVDLHFKVVTVGSTGSAGRTEVVVEYEHIPTAVIEAVKS